MYRFKQMLQQHYHTICARADSTKLCADIKSGQISYIYTIHIKYIRQVSQVNEAASEMQRQSL